MHRYRAWLVPAVAATALPAVMAHASDSPPAPTPRVEAGQTQPPRIEFATTALFPAGRTNGLTLNPGADASAVRAKPFRHGTGDDAATVSRRPIDHPYSLTSPAAGGTGLNLPPAGGARKPGWEMSGRVGPVRWLNTVDGETKLRFGGHLPGQPQMPGMGLFNVGVHYNFE